MTFTYTDVDSFFIAGKFAFSTDIDGEKVARENADKSKLNSEVLDKAYDSSKTYEVDNTCTYEGKWYKCKTAITSAHAWKSNEWEELNCIPAVAHEITYAKYLDGSFKTFCFNGTLSADTIPDKANVVEIHIGRTVTAIGKTAFKNFSSLLRVSIPNSVVEIGGWAFERCGQLQAAIVPSSVTTIGSQAFMWCTGLTNGVFLEGKTMDDVRSMNNYPWGITDANKIHAINIDGKLNSVVEKTWSELVDAKNNGTLIPG